jgi:serine/threonine-protein kinase HipA
LSGGRLPAGRVFHAIQARHWQQLASKHGGDTVWAAMIELVSGVDSGLTRGERILPKNFPADTGRPSSPA